ncbi:site-specific DNA-methyltransferase [Syntrophomonas wolfei]|uniref:site-specific DNA-methyltransferase n=1 Tax=Syntrophomonas wolfei TaxID=863 RepID=UPI0007740407|nr:site-specific DNA-methyltransferase [Syntrophomonas wolfei]
MNKPKFETPNLTAENVAKIAELFPGVVTEGKVNFDLLRSMLGDEVYGDEAYEFTWVGKRAAIAEAGRPIRKTLRPCVEESKDWDMTENLYIEGDNLDVLKLLQESYLGKVKMVYIDPPYNTGSDSFVYNDDNGMDAEEYDDGIDAYDDEGNINFRANLKTNPRFHSGWCSMIYSRLVLTRNLLSKDGVIFISIDDGEVAQLRKLCDEVFGEENFIAIISRVAKTTSFRGNYFAPSKDYLLCFAKSIYDLPGFSDEVDSSQFKKIETVGERKGEYYRDDIAFYLSTLETRPNQRYFIECPDGEKVIPPGTTFPPEKPVDGDGVWRWSLDNFELKKHLIVFKESTRSPLINEQGKPARWNLYTKSYLSDKQESGNLPRDLFDKFLNRNGSEDLKRLDIPFDFPKPVNLIKHLLKILNDEKDGIILDFFSGSATTAHAVMQLNAEDGGKRKFIMVQLPEVCADGTKAAKAGYKNICEIGKERIRRAGDKIKAEAGLTALNLDIGFRVLKLDDTNMKDVYYAAGDYTQDMIALMESNIKPDRTDLDLLYGCLLDWGLPLSMPHTHEKIDGFTIHTYNDGDLIACFEERISEKAIREIASRKPLRAVFRDSSFNSSPEKINVFEIFKLLAPNTNVRVI